MKVGIVGLGFAGLRAAMLLQRRGIEPLLFEARDRVGGRAHTIRGVSGYYDAGGEWIDADHVRVLALLDELGLVPEKPDQWPGRVIYQGEECNERDLWADVAESSQRLQDASDELCLDLEPVPWDNVIYSHLDQQSLEEFVRAKATTPRAMWALQAMLRSDEGEELDRISLLSRLCSDILTANRESGDMSAFRFPGGAQSVAEAMLRRTNLTPRLEMPLSAIEREDGRLRLVFPNDSEVVDAVILTLPPPALASVRFDPPLSVSKEVAIEGSQMARAIKISLRFREPFWQEQGWSGRMLCDLPIQQTWDSSHDGLCVLNCYVCGDEAERFLASSDPVGRAVRCLAELASGVDDLFIEGAVHDWIGDPYCGGAFSYVPPGFALSGLSELHRPEGNIHFAGEHTSAWIGFYEGALESAERVAEEVALARV